MTKNNDGDNDMARFLLCGVPLGFSCSECPQEDRKVLETNYADGHYGDQLQIVRLPNGNMYYNYLMYPPKGRFFADAAGRSGAFFCMSLVVQNQIVNDTDKLIKLFQKTYQEYVKDKIITEQNDGNKKFLVSNLRPKGDGLAIAVGQGFMDIMKKNPELNIFHNIKAYSPPQIQQGILSRRIQVR